MKTRARLRRRILGVAMLVSASMVIGPVVAHAGRNANPQVLPVNSTPYGHSYGEWASMWWQWAFSIPLHDPPYTGPPNHPLFDETGSLCGVGQSGKVWFLGGVVNVSGTATRDCGVPAGRALFFPIANTECSTLEGNGTTEAELRACAKASIDGVTDLEADIDGRGVQGLAGYRVTSPLFSFTLPADNFLEFFGVPGADPGTYYPSADDGIYLMVAPLSAGSHTVHFHAMFNPSFTLDITYNLVVG
jgi:hypothetical protein